MCQLTHSSVSFTAEAFSAGSDKSHVIGGMADLDG